MDGDLAAAQAASNQSPMHLGSGSSSSSGFSLDRSDSQEEVSGSNPGYIAAEIPATSASQGETPHPWSANHVRAPLSPQPDRPNPLGLNRLLSKSGPTSPTQQPSKVWFLPSSPSQESSTTATAVHFRDDSSISGSVQIPGRSNHATTEGLEGLGERLGEGLEGASPPDGYLADSEQPAARHRLQHSLASFR